MAVRTGTHPGEADPAGGSRPIYARVRHEEKTTAGLVSADMVTLLPPASSPAAGWDALAGLAGRGRTVPLSSCQLKPPAEPRIVLGVMGNFPPSTRGRDTTRPSLFVKSACSVTGPGPIALEPSAGHVISEPELAIVVGKEAHRVPVAGAPDFIFGYTLVNDITAPHLLYEDDVSLAKGLPGFCPIGPWIVPIDQHLIGGLHVEGRLNGSIVSTGSVCDMRFSPAEVLSYASGCLTLQAGDVICLGTAKPTAKAGINDQVEASAAEIGALINTFCSAEKAAATCS